MALRTFGKRGFIFAHEKPRGQMDPGVFAKDYQELYTSVHHGLAFTLINSTSKTSAA